MAGRLHYNAGLFHKSTAERMVQHLTVLLGSAAAEPSAHVLHLPFIAQEERQQVGLWAPAWAMADA